VLDTVVAPLGSFLFIPEHRGEVGYQVRVACFTEFVGDIVAEGFGFVEVFVEFSKQFYHRGW